MNEGTSYTPMVHLFDGGGFVVQWNPEAPERALFAVVGDDEAPPSASAPGARANVSSSSSFLGREARYVGRSSGRPVVFSVRSDAGVLSRQPDSATALPNGLTVAMAFGQLTRLWGPGAGPVVSSPGGVGTLVSECPIVLDRQSNPRACTVVPGERFEVTPVLSRRFTPPISSSEAYLMQVSSSRTLVLARPDGGIAALERLPLDGGRPFAPLALGCHRPEPGRAANLSLSLLYVTTDDGQVLSIVTPSTGLNTDAAWPKHQGGLVNQGTDEGEVALRAECP
ncbi:MAG: hypothetical protein MUC96_24770 [Myxococcaceae bacterium]|nr:hypothetical protein [Myxococcaceae bacterium]